MTAFFTSDIVLLFLSLQLTISHRIEYCLERLSAISEARTQRERYAREKQRQAEAAAAERSALKLQRAERVKREAKWRWLMSPNRTLNEVTMIQKTVHGGFSGPCSEDTTSRHAEVS